MPLAFSQVMHLCCQVKMEIRKERLPKDYYNYHLIDSAMPIKRILEQPDIKVPLFK